MNARIALSPYSLRFRGTQKYRNGFLLRLEFADLGYGYSDIFPWPEFGDPACADIPQLLKAWSSSAEGQFSLLTKPNSYKLLQQSLFFAEQDAKARAEKRSLTDGIQIENHFLLTDLKHNSDETILKAKDNGFTTFKIKVGVDSENEIAQLKKLRPVVDSMQMRFDFNTKGTRSNLEQLVQLGFKIDFIEDPFSTPLLWQGNPLPFAYDQPGFAYEDVKTEWQIIKPARQNNDEIRAPRIVFTSSMDHPVGIVHACVQSMQYGQQVCDYGLMSQFIFEPTEFHTHLIADGPRLAVEPGWGIGFDDLLAKQDWRGL